MRIVKHLETIFVVVLLLVGIAGGLFALTYLGVEYHDYINEESEDGGLLDDDDSGLNEESEDGGLLDDDDSGPEFKRAEQLVLDVINEIREDRGLDPMQMNKTLRRVARNHSQEMANLSYFSHTNPDGKSPFERMEAAGVNCRAGAENIAKTHWDKRIIDGPRITTVEKLAESLVNQWMNSPGHRRNILDGDFDKSGIGIVKTEDDEIYATHDFCF
jgi:uncharacterized protein YkwD